MKPVVALLLVLAVGACSSSRAHSPAASSAASGSPADPATRQAITAAYEAFFASTSTTAQSEAALQHGSVFADTLRRQAESSYAKDSGVQVTSVSVHGDVADVTFTITSNGSPLLTGFRGFAVHDAGRWRVAAKTFCTLLTLEGDAPAVCADPKITSLP